MPTGTVPPSRLGKVCRVTIFVSIFLLVTDSRLRPAFLSKFSADPSAASGASHKSIAQEGRSFFQREVALADKPDSSILLRRIRRQAEEEEEETTEEPTEENGEQDGDGAVPSEENEEGEEAAEKPEKEGETEEEEEAEEEATTVRTRRSTTRTTTTTKKTTTPSPLTTTDDDDDDVTSVANASHSTGEPEATTENDCSVPAIRQFPPDAFSQQARQYGAIIVHLSVVVYMFVSLAIVCDDYFCGSLEQVCKRLNLSEDVAGATLMAAGSSAPELFASLIGVFVAKGDVGTGTIVGSAVFNIMFVVGTCAFFAGNEGAQLSWWPIIRDTGFYWISIAVLIGALYDGYVTWYESLIMLMLYGLYVVAMLYNTRIYNFVVQKTGWTGPVQGIEETERLAGGGGRFNKIVYSGYEQFANETDEMPMASQKPSAITQSADERIRRNPRKLTFANAALRIMMSPRYFYPRTRFIAAARFVIGENQVHAHEKRRGRIATTFSNAANHSLDSDYGTEARINETNRGKFRAARSFEVISDEFEKWRIRPQPGAGYPAFARWIILYPIYFVLYYTIPDSKKERFAKWYVATFGISIAWIAVFSYIMVWMVTVVGHTLAIPDSIMGITFLAAGTSIPDAMASLIVARQGMVDMAVSNSIGSNVFDILIGLALPWFLSCAIIYPGTAVKINSNGLVFNAVLLFFSVVVANVGFRSQGWRLTRQLGMIFYGTYGIYLVLAVMIEYNVFGYVNPPMCTDEEADLKEGLISVTKAP